MSDSSQNQDPMEFFKSLWGNLGIPLPGMVTPTVDTDELGRRITDLKAVEGWLKSNLSMLQMTIQGLEMQRATLMAFQAMTQSPEEKSEVQPNAFWPWNFMQPTSEGDNKGPTATETQPAPQPPTEASAPKRKPKG